MRFHAVAGTERAYGVPLTPIADVEVRLLSGEVPGGTYPHRGNGRSRLRYIHHFGDDGDIEDIHIHDVHLIPAGGGLCVLLLVAVICDEHQEQKGILDATVHHIVHRAAVGMHTAHGLRECRYNHYHLSTAADFRKSIGNSLPKYMIPVVYHRLPELKRNTNGKIDRLYYSKLVEE